MRNEMTVTQAEAVICKKVCRQWQDRALEMLRHMADSRTTVANLYVPKDWPLNRGITFCRVADGKSVVLYFDKKKQKFYGKAL